MSVRLSVSMEQPGSTGRIFIKSDVWRFFENLSRKFTIR
jgi:hypothetical protein